MHSRRTSAPLPSASLSPCPSSPRTPTVTHPFVISPRRKREADDVLAEQAADPRAHQPLHGVAAGRELLLHPGGHALVRLALVFVFVVFRSVIMQDFVSCRAGKFCSFSPGECVICLLAIPERACTALSFGPGARVHGTYIHRQAP